MAFSSGDVVHVAALGKGAVREVRNGGRYASRSSVKRRMSDRVFLDTDILVYTLGQRDDRTPKADALLESGGVVSVQVLNELASVASRKLRMSWPDVTAALADIKILCPSPIPITVETHDASSFSTWTLTTPPLASNASAFGVRSSRCPSA